MPLALLPGGKAASIENDVPLTQRNVVAFQ
jgi:hypothetical protein